MPTYRQNNGHIFTYQTPATLNQANPVQNTWYTILDTTSNVILYAVGVNVEDTNETLECKITVDGETLGMAAALAATHSTEYMLYQLPNAVSRLDTLNLDARGTVITYGQYPLLYGKSVKVELRKTTAAGAGNLTGIVIYGVLEAI